MRTLRFSAQFGAFLTLSLFGFAQGGPSLSGSFAYVAVAKQSDSFGESGGALVGLLNFDGAGNISGTAVLKARTGAFEDADTGSSAVQGTYTTNPDGSGTTDITFVDFGFSAKSYIVITDGGKGFYFSEGPTSTNSASLNTNLPGTPERISGSLPGGFFLLKSLGAVPATGQIPVTLNRASNDSVAIYSLTSPVTATGSVACPDGKSDTWTVNIPSITAVIRNLTGNFMLPALVSACGRRDIFNYTGLANLNPTQTGVSLALHLTGYFIVGSARLTTGGIPNGSYSVQALGEPFPGASVQIYNFDGSGGVTTTNFAPGPAGPVALVGTYKANPDGTGTISLTQTANPNAVPLSFFYAIADDGSISILRTSGGGAGADVTIVAGRRQ